VIDDWMIDDRINNNDFLQPILLLSIIKLSIIGHPMVNLVLIEPDIPQNLGAALRLSACLGCAVHVVEPCGFAFDDQKLKRAGMDYIAKATLIRHADWSGFLAYRHAHPGRLLLLETDGAIRYTDMAYRAEDYILLGRESAGTPKSYYAAMDEVITIPMRPGARSLNVAMAAGMVAAEAARQRNWSFA
jgi:tRNA (cytidine/uridine-2'-O-)-methyltransferase